MAQQLTTSRIVQMISMWLIALMCIGCMNYQGGGNGVPKLSGTIITITNSDDLVVCEYYEESNTCEYKAFVPLSVLYGGRYPLVARCERHHRRFVRHLSRHGWDVIPLAYWTVVICIPDDLWEKSIQDMTTIWAAEVLRVFNGRVFARGNHYPPPIESALALDHDTSLAPALKVTLDLNRQTVKIGEELVVGIETKNLKKMPLVFPPMFGDPIMLAFQEMETGRIHVIRKASAVCVRPYDIGVIPTGKMARVESTIKVSSTDAECAETVFRARKGEYRLTILDLGHYGIATSCSPVPLTVEDGDAGNRNSLAPF